jgi:C-terminal processing protease CtpA/Prc
MDVTSRVDAAAEIPEAARLEAGVVRSAFSLSELPRPADDLAWVRYGDAVNLTSPPSFDFILVRKFERLTLTANFAPGEHSGFGASLNDRHGGGLVVTAVEGPLALAAGLQARDQILSVNGTKIQNKEEAVAAFRQAMTDGRVELGVVRPNPQVANETITVQKPLSGGLGASIAPESPRVTSVNIGGAADVAGLRPGMEIVSVDGRPVRSTRELVNILAGKPAGAIFDIGVG